MFFLPAPRLRFGVTASRASTSRRDNPSDFSRIFRRSSGSYSFPSTMMLRRPICLINCRAWSSAPAPMESIEITAPTPKMIPSMVSSERNLRFVRLSSDWVMLSWTFMVKLRIADFGLRISICNPQSSRPDAFRQLGCGVRIFLLDLRFGRIQKDRLSFAHPGEERDSRTITWTDFHRSFLGSSGAVHPDEELAVFLAQCAPRDDQRVLQLSDGNSGAHHFAGPQDLTVLGVNFQENFEILDG